MKNTLGYAALSATDALAPFQFERRELRPDDVVLAVRYCGVCHTDLHIARNHGSYTRYPVVPGHETRSATSPASATEVIALSHSPPTGPVGTCF